MSITQLEAQEYRDRAHAAEDELAALRKDLKAYRHKMRYGTAGPVIWRSEVADYLSDLLGL